MKLGTILGVWAHPDDESFLSAGLMAQAVRDRGRVVCVTATRGEEGFADKESISSVERGRIREAELTASLRILGVEEHHWLDYHDGKCHEVSLEEGAARVKEFISRVKPDSILTFGPDGMTGHADHKAVSAWTTRAFDEVAGQGSSIYFATQTKEWADVFAPRFAEFNVFGPGTPPITPKDELAIDFELDDDLIQLKVKALEAQKSQIEGMLTVLGHDLFLAAQRRETFRLAQTK